MELVTKQLKDIKPYAKNPRKNDAAVAAVAESIRQCEYIAPIIIDEDGVILAGHTRYKALLSLGYIEAECVVKADLTDEQKRKYRLLDNKTNELAEWDFDLLMDELDGLDFDGFDFGFDIDDEEQPYRYDGGVNGSLTKRFGAPPFSILDARQGYWVERKRKWREIIGDSKNGREVDNLTTQGLFKNGREMSATSEFDSVLCEIILSWFCPVGGSVFDPFAGGSVRGVISELTGHRYTGIDIRQEQIDENEKAADGLGVNPTWICGDSIEADKIVKQSGFDLVMSCPPYGDLEVYSDLPGDISNKEYDDFLKAYREIVKVAVGKLADDRFAVFVVGDIRDKKGLYRGFVKDTICAFEDCGAHLYNEIILIDIVGSSAIRAKTHQNVLVFYKGDVRKIKDNYGEVYLPEIDE